MANKKRYDEIQTQVPSWAQDYQAQQSQQTQTPTWSDQVADLYNQITSRPNFKYGPNSDPLWQSAKDQYVHAGRRAMEDTMGQTAALTGGYSSSYAQSAGQQQYDEYMTKLNAKVAEYAQMARANYDADTDKLYDRLNYAQSMAQQDYERGRDALADQRYEQEWAQQQRAYEDDLAYRQWQQQQSGQNRAYEMVMQMIATGQTPSAELLAQAGVGADYARSMANYYAQQAAGSGSGGSGGRSYGGGSGSGDDGKKQRTLNDYATTMRNLSNAGNRDEANALMEEMYASKNLSASEKEYLVKLYDKLFGDKAGSSSGSGGARANDKPTMHLN